MTIKSTLRSAIYQTEKLAQRVRFASISVPQAGWPILLSISFPKSGTHLLDQILLGFAKVAPFSRRLHSFFAGYDGESGRKRSLDETLAWVDSLRPLDIISAHLFAWDEVVSRICKPAFIPYFIFRDPRDVVVSHVFYVTDMEERHVHHDYYASLPDFNSRLKTSILGLPTRRVERSRSGAGSSFDYTHTVPGHFREDEELLVEFPDIAGRFAPYMKWLDQPEVMTIHFEDLIEDRTAALNRIIDHFLRRVPLHTSRELIFEALESSINPSKSPTFRSGKTGEWKKYFTDENRRIFKDVAGDLLVKLGYEKNNDW
jgi:sulfotransferase 6B1